MEMSAPEQLQLMLTRVIDVFPIQMQRAKGKPISALLDF